MRIFVPTLGSLWRMRAGWPIPVDIIKSHRNQTFVKGIHRPMAVSDWKKATGASTERKPGEAWPSDWVKRYNEWADALIAEGGFLIPENTIIRMNRIHMGESDDKTSIELMQSPEPRFCPKKAGGAAKGRLRLFIPVEVLNTFPELEPWS